MRKTKAPGRYLKKFLTGACLICTVVVFAPQVSSAQVFTGDASQFSVTIKGVNLCTSSAKTDCDSVGATTASFDIASTSVGGDVGSYANFDDLQQGKSYSHLEVIVSRRFTLKGTVNAGGTTCITDDAQNAANSTENFNPNTLTLGKKSGDPDSQFLFIPDVGAFGSQPTQEAYAAVGLSLDADGITARGLIALPGGFTPGPNPLQIEIGFSTKSALGAVLVSGNCVMLVQPPRFNIVIK